MEELKPVAREVLGTLSSISDAASARLREKGLSLDGLANSNQVTSPTLVGDMQSRNRERTGNLQELRHKPAIARLVIADEDDNHETLYVAPNAEVSLGGTRICSYLANRGKGRLVARNVGDGDYVELPTLGRRYFEVVEKLTFAPHFGNREWDSRPAVHFRESAAPLTIKSLRDLLREAGIDADEFDLDGWASETSADDNIAEGIQRQIRTAMELRHNPYLDLVQEKIFRLPLDSRIAVLGPPGTGKTTTLVRRLRQKIDAAALDPEEEALVAQPDKAGRNHAESWLMFTPTELLRQYVIGAFNREGVPAPDDRLKTWDDYRADLGKKLRVLRTVGGGGGLAINGDPAQLLSEALVAMPAWFADFDTHQRTGFIARLRVEADRIAASPDAAAALLGRQVVTAIDRSGGNVMRLLAELLGLRDRLRAQTGALRRETQQALRQVIVDLRKADDALLDDLEKFAAQLLSEHDDAADEPDEDEDEDDEAVAPSERGRKHKPERDLILRTLRTAAIARANSRCPAPSSKAGRVLAWLEARGVSLPEMRELGRTLLVQRAFGRISRAPADYLGKLMLRYRAFRREARAEGRWYGDAKMPAAHAHPIEIDLLLLGVLRAANEMESDRLVSQRLGDERPALMNDVARERRNQILVDEATDFSPVQLACMYALSDGRTRSLFLSGDFNQRLTSWGSRSDDDLAFVCDDLIVEPISVTYRQSRKLATFAAALVGDTGFDASASMPKYSENVGLDPVAGRGLAGVFGQARWLAARVREIVQASNGVMPTIAVLMPDETELEAMAEALTEELRGVTIKARAYRNGVARGLDQDIRVFSVEHIKGLEFEGVFFVGVDRIAEDKPELLGRYLYVGATRAATYLGLTTASETLPGTLGSPDLSYRQSW